VKNIYQSFSHKMAAKASQHRNYVTVTLCIQMSCAFINKRHHSSMAANTTDQLSCTPDRNSTLLNSLMHFGLKMTSGGNDFTDLLPPNFFQEAACFHLSMQ